MRGTASKATTSLMRTQLKPRMPWKVKTFSWDSGSAKTPWKAAICGLICCDSSALRSMARFVPFLRWIVTRWMWITSAMFSSYRICHWFKKRFFKTQKPFRKPRGGKMGAEFLGFRFSGNRLLGIFLLFITISSQILAGLLLTLWTKEIRSPLFRAGQDKLKFDWPEGFFVLPRKKPSTR